MLFLSGPGLKKVPTDWSLYIYYFTFSLLHKPIKERFQRVLWYSHKPLLSNGRNPSDCNVLTPDLRKDLC